MSQIQTLKIVLSGNVVLTCLVGLCQSHIYLRCLLSLTLLVCRCATYVWVSAGVQLVSGVSAGVQLVSGVSAGVQLVSACPHVFPAKPQLLRESILTTFT